MGRSIGNLGAVKPRVLVIQHEDDCPPGWFGEWLDASGVELDVVRGHRGDAVPPGLGDQAGLLVLGGEMGAYDDERCPWLVPTRQLIARTVAEGRPFLGICLGLQLAAVALGGTVGRNPAGQAVGLTPVRLAHGADADVLLCAVEDGVRAVQWNEDIVTELPAASKPLAFSPDSSVQAARFGPLAWGVQFHPEVSPQIFAGWTSAVTAGKVRVDGVDPVAATAVVKDARAELRSAWRPLAERFAAIVHEAAADSARPEPRAGTPGDAVPSSPTSVPVS
jgi:GMP synthase (glutamine-hydrolysing)